MNNSAYTLENFKNKFINDIDTFVKNGRKNTDYRKIVRKMHSLFGHGHPLHQPLLSIINRVRDGSTMTNISSNLENVFNPGSARRVDAEAERRAKAAEYTRRTAEAERRAAAEAEYARRTAETERRAAAEAEYARRTAEAERRAAAEAEEQKKEAERRAAEEAEMQRLKEFSSVSRPSRVAGTPRYFTFEEAEKLYKYEPKIQSIPKQLYEGNEVIIHKHEIGDYIIPEGYELQEISGGSGANGRQLYRVVKILSLKNKIKSFFTNTFTKKSPGPVNIPRSTQYRKRKTSPAASNKTRKSMRSKTNIK